MKADKDLKIYTTHDKGGRTYDMQSGPFVVFVTRRIVFFFN